MIGYTLQHKLAVISSLEVVLMSMGNTKYNLVVAKLGALYNVGIRDTFDHPEYLKVVLKEVYHGDYDYIIGEVKAQLAELAYEKNTVQFFKILEN